MGGVAVPECPIQSLGYTGLQPGIIKSNFRYDESNCREKRDYFKYGFLGGTWLVGRRPPLSRMAQALTRVYSGAR